MTNMRTKENMQVPNIKNKPPPPPEPPKPPKTRCICDLYFIKNCSRKKEFNCLREGQ
jgi:hypothetical protein